jgi:ribosomal protein S20
VPNIKSQAKRVEVSAKENAINTAKRTKVKNAVKKFNAAIEAKDIKAAEALLPETVSIIDAAKSDGIYHKNTAARKVATLNKSLNALKASASI